MISSDVHVLKDLYLKALRCFGEVYKDSVSAQWAVLLARPRRQHVLTIISRNKLPLIGALTITELPLRNLMSAAVQRVCIRPHAKDRG